MKCKIRLSAIFIVAVLFFLFSGCEINDYKKDFSSIFGFNFNMTQDEIIRYESVEYGNTVYEVITDANEKEDILWFDPCEFEGETKWKHMYYFDKKTGLLNTVVLWDAVFRDADSPPEEQAQCQHIDSYVMEILSIIGTWDKDDGALHYAYGRIDGKKCMIQYEDLFQEETHLAIFSK